NADGERGILHVHPPCPGARLAEKEIEVLAAFGCLKGMRVPDRDVADELPEIELPSRGRLQMDAGVRRPRIAALELVGHDLFGSCLAVMPGFSALDRRPFRRAQGSRDQQAHPLLRQSVVILGNTTTETYPRAPQNGVTPISLVMNMRDVPGGSQEMR